MRQIIVIIELYSKTDSVNSAVDGFKQGKKNIFPSIVFQPYVLSKNYSSMHCEEIVRETVNQQNNYAESSMYRKSFGSD